MKKWIIKAVKKVLNQFTYASDQLIVKIVREIESKR